MIAFIPNPNIVRLKANLAKMQAEARGNSHPKLVHAIMVLKNDIASLEEADQQRKALTVGV
jgi:uncharacterized protein (DUF362 family)